MYISTIVSLFSFQYLSLENLSLERLRELSMSFGCQTWNPSLDFHSITKVGDTNVLSKYNASANPDPNPDIFHSKTLEISVEHQRAHEQFRQAIKYRNCTDLHPVKVFNRDPDFEPVRISGNRSVQFPYFNYFYPGFSSQLVDQSTFLFPYTIFLLGTGNHSIRC